MNQIHPYDRHSSLYNFLFHPLHTQSKVRKAAALVTHIFLSVITLCIWQLPFWVMNRMDHSKLVNISKNPGAILYMSITGNPTHLGHMAAIATAIDALAKRHIHVSEAKISLSGEGYHEHKVKSAKQKGVNKIALSLEARKHLLFGAIEEAKRRGMFKGIPVNYWNDQDKGPSDHPESYHRLVKETPPTHRVYLVAGDDLCKSMGNWPDIAHAIVIQRKMPNDDYSQIVYPSTKQERIYTPSLYPQYETYSSTSIQKGEKRLEPSSLHKYFIDAQLATAV